MKALLTASALAASLSVTYAWAAPTKLDSSQLDAITAGTESSNPAPNGGAIVGNGSTATLDSTGTIKLSDTAQSDARALNAVNSSESTVANGVNVFDGRADKSAAVDGAQYDISQRNSVTQDQRRLSSLPSYERGANTTTMTTDSGSTSSDSSSSLVNDHANLIRKTTLNESTTQGSVDRSKDPTLKIHADGTLGDLNGTYDAEFNMPSAEGSIGAVFNGGVDYSIDGGKFTIDNGNGLTATLKLPKLDLNLDATGCLVANGNCSIDGTRKQSTDNINDHSTHYSSDSSSSSSKTWDRTSQETVNAPFKLQNAQAEYIVVDQSEIKVTAAYLVDLSGGAQSGLRAMNAVNSAGSAVANGVNVATQRSGDLNISGSPVYTLNQVNDINHSR